MKNVFLFIRLSIVISISLSKICLSVLIKLCIVSNHFPKICISVYMQLNVNGKYIYVRVLRNLLTLRADTNDYYSLKNRFLKIFKKKAVIGDLWKKKVLETRTPLHKSISELDPYIINSFKNRPGMFEILQQISFKKKKK